MNQKTKFELSGVIFSCYVIFVAVTTLVSKLPFLENKLLFFLSSHNNSLAYLSFLLDIYLVYWLVQTLKGREIKHKVLLGSLLIVFTWFLLSYNTGLIAHGFFTSYSDIKTVAGLLLVPFLTYFFFENLEETKLPSEWETFVASLLHKLNIILFLCFFGKLLLYRQVASNVCSYTLRLHLIVFFVLFFVYVLKKWCTTKKTPKEALVDQFVYLGLQTATATNSLVFAGYFCELQIDLLGFLGLGSYKLLVLLWAGLLCGVYLYKNAEKYSEKIFWILALLGNQIVFAAANAYALNFNRGSEGVMVMLKFSTNAVFFPVMLVIMKNIITKQWGACFKFF